MIATKNKKLDGNQRHQNVAKPNMGRIKESKSFLKWFRISSETFLKLFCTRKRPFRISIETGLKSLWRKLCVTVVKLVLDPYRKD